jgi:hypothetical protein
MPASDTRSDGGATVLCDGDEVLELAELREQSIVIRCKNDSSI